MGADALDSAEFFEAADDAELAGQSLVVELGAYEGPLHTLLDLARARKVDLSRISVSELADQYLDFIRAAERNRIELAAEYLVMAAWLALLKSRLLLPKAVQLDEPVEDAGKLAVALQFRLMRLEAMREQGRLLFRRAQIGQDVFTRGAFDEQEVIQDGEPEVDIWGLLKAYASVRTKPDKPVYERAQPNVYALDAARACLREALPKARDWTALERFAPRFEGVATPPPQPSRIASIFAASLELCRDGEADLRQAAAFAELFIKARRKEDVAGDGPA